jgi:3-hydroxybutyryl-CoA dehydrogenase
VALEEFAVERIGVVGCGQMGGGIAEVVARSGLDVFIVESSAEARDAGRDRVLAALAKSLERGTVTGEDHGAAVQRLHFTTALEDLASVDFVIEAVSEQADIKFDLFRRLDAICGADTVLASNTSSIPIHSIADVTAHPERVIGLHFFNPVPVMKLVEVIATPRTSADTKRLAYELTSALNKTAISAPDQAGFLVNYLLIPYLVSAIRLFESGLASAQDIDNGMMLGCGHPMGPLRLTDLIGLDTTLAIADLLHDSFPEPQMQAPSLLRSMVRDGKLGRKSSEGFFSYPANGA